MRSPMGPLLVSNWCGSILKLLTSRSNLLDSMGALTPMSGTTRQTMRSHEASSWTRTATLGKIIFLTPFIVLTRPLKLFKLVNWTLFSVLWLTQESVLHKSNKVTTWWFGFPFNKTEPQLDNCYWSSTSSWLARKHSEGVALKHLILLTSVTSQPSGWGTMTAAPAPDGSAVALGGTLEHYPVSPPVWHAPVWYASVLAPLVACLAPCAPPVCDDPLTHKLFHPCL